MGENDFISINIAVVTISDTRELKNDKSGDTLVNKITQFGHKVTVREIVKEDFDYDLLYSRAEKDPMYGAIEKGTYI